MHKSDLIDTKSVLRISKSYWVGWRINGYKSSFRDFKKLPNARSRKRKTEKGITHFPFCDIWLPKRYNCFT